MCVCEVDLLGSQPTELGEGSHSLKRAKYTPISSVCQRAGTFLKYRGLKNCISNFVSISSLGGNSPVSKNIRIY